MQMDQQNSVSIGIKYRSSLHDLGHELLPAPKYVLPIVCEELRERTMSLLMVSEFLSIECVVGGLMVIEMSIGLMTFPQFAEQVGDEIS